jgi:CRISPR type IV-associated protein Csf3
MLIDTASGRYMERRIPVPVRTADVWAATMIGDPDEVTRLLHFVRSIGKGRSIGLGEVAEWHVADYDEFSLHRDGRLIRSLPADAAHAMGISMTGDPEPLIGWTPPYWHPVLRRPGYRTGHPVAPGG